MDISYLSVLTTVNANAKTDYTVVKSQNDNFKSFIMDEANFKNADSNSDNFLSYSELSDIKLSPTYDVQNNLFKLKQGFDLLTNNTIKKILDNSGLSLKLLEENFKELDKNKDNKITSNEINPELTKMVDTQKRDYRAFKMQKLTQKINTNKEQASQNKEIEALDKQIASLKKMLHSLKSQNAETPATPNKNDAKNIATTGIGKKLAIDGLKAKYGEKDTNKLISTILKTPNATKHISSVMYQSGTKATEKEVAAVAGLIQDTALNKVAVKEMSDMNAIEQLSPANTPVVIVEDNLDLTISNIEDKIQDLEGMKDKILTKATEKSAANIYQH
jgi:ribosomal protein L29